MNSRQIPSQRLRLKVKQRSGNVEIPVRVVLVKSPKKPNTKRKNHINQTTKVIPSQNITTTTRDLRSRGLKERTITTTSISRQRVGITISTKTNIGTIQTTIGRESAQSGRGRSVTSRGRVGGNHRGTGRRIGPTGGTRGRTTGRARSGTGPTTGRVETTTNTTSTIGMSGLGTTTGAARAAAAAITPDTAGELQVTDPTGCTFILFYIVSERQLT